MADVSIIIRTKNEERWIGHCLKAVFSQSFKDFEVILVDNNSTDHTVEVARRYPVKEIIKIERFKPGYAINEGIRRSSGKYLVCLSAHCVPQHEKWLENLLRNFEDAKIAGVYGRQLPLSYSEASDKRDLLITFGLDKRIQEKDYFFHNANSMFRRDIWEKYPFDENATNIEDRIWGQAVIGAGYKLAYEPEAQVYHHHGIHQDNNPERAKSVVSVLEGFDPQISKDLPDFLKAENSQIVAVVPVLGEPKEIDAHNLLSELIEQLKSSAYLKKIYVLSEVPDVKKLASKSGVDFIERPKELCSKDKTLEDALCYALSQIEAKGVYPDALLNANYLYPFRPEGLFDQLIIELQAKGLETVFAGFTDYNNVWAVDAKGSYSQVGEGLKNRDKKQPLYEALYGCGCVSSSHVIRSGRLIGERVGIYPLTNRIHTLKYTDEDSAALIEAVFQQARAAKAV